ncbi:hypothetical protein M405DRAFT_882971 [Rhizopogon salebrosus TDB-379]|nr:hypothetical protein M405DRAFT_882971 [Rhizopogon salebrosus TDB-379]
MSSTESATVTGHSNHTGYDTFDRSKRDTRRYGTLLPAQIAEGLSLVYPDDEDEDDSGTYTDFLSSWEFTPASPSPAPVASARKSKLSGAIQTSEAQQLAKEYQERPVGATEAQKIVHDYYRKHDGNIEVEGSTVVHISKELPALPDHRNSTYTLATTEDGRSTIDLEKRPGPAIRLFHHDQGGLAQAQHQGMEMIQAARWTPGGTICCQRPGCTDVLRDLEALKFHLHIHNIGDMSDARSTISAHSPKTKETRHTHMESPQLIKPRRKVHNRSKSSIEIDATSCQSCSINGTRKSDVMGSSSLPGSRKPSATYGSSSAPNTRTKSPSPSRGRRSNRGTIQYGLSEAGYNDSIAMVLSRPTSPVPSTEEVLDPKMNFNLGFVNYKSSFSSPASPARGEKAPSRAKSPNRAFSPARALSPIRDGLRRVLSLGCLSDWNNQ